MPCLMVAWVAYKAELRAWLQNQLLGVDASLEVDDLLQELFLKALRQDRKFCGITNPRAWFFRVARNAITDRLRARKELVVLPGDLLQEELSAVLPVDALAACLPRALTELSHNDRTAIMLCDLDGMPQAEFASYSGITIASAKSRVQRARLRLREHITRACQVRFDSTGCVCCFVPRSAVP